MHFKNLLLASLLALASATPMPQAATYEPLPADAKFQLVALLPGSEIDSAPFSAALSRIALNLPNQNATCDTESDGFATFYLKDGGLYLYATSAPLQQLYADRSGMGQGYLGYTNDGRGTRYAELSGWVLDEYNELTLNGTGFTACPNSINGAWYVWMAGFSQPAGSSGCVGISVIAVENCEPNSCLYTS